MTKKEHFPLRHKEARTFGLSKSDKALQKLLGQCANNTQRIQLLVEALDLARDEGAAANVLIGALNVRVAEWERAAKANMDLAEANMNGWEAEREACAKIADSYGIHWGEARDVPKELARIAMGGPSQIPSVEIAAAIRARGGTKS